MSSSLLYWLLVSCFVLYRRTQSVGHEPLRRQGSSTTSRPPQPLSAQAIKHIWVRTALFEKVLDKIVQYIVDNSRWFLLVFTLALHSSDSPHSTTGFVISEWWTVPWITYLAFHSALVLALLLCFVLCLANNHCVLRQAVLTWCLSHREIMHYHFTDQSLKHEKGLMRYTNIWQCESHFLNGEKSSFKDEYCCLML